MTTTTTTALIRRPLPDEEKETTSNKKPKMIAAVSPTANDSSSSSSHAGATIDQKQEEDTQQSEKIVFLSHPEDLEESIFQKEVQLAIWRRSKIPDFVQQLSNPLFNNNDSSDNKLPTFYGKVTPNTVVELMKQKLLPKNNNNKNGCLSEAHILQLIEDVRQLVTVFDAIVGQDVVHVRLERLEGNGCAFWHQDTVPLRMVTTYRGPCTEYVHPDMSQITLSNRQNNSKHAKSLTHYDVALFKGRCFDTDMNEEEEEEDEEEDEDEVKMGSGIVHRSPRIEGTGVVRLVLVLDIPADFHDASSDEQDNEEEEADDE